MRLFLKLLLAAVLLAALPSALAIRAQEPLNEPNAPSPATRHAQVIAHGVMAMPAEEVGWRATTERALPPGRAASEAGSAGFLLSYEGTIALADPVGAIQTRLAPGEAVWIDDADDHAIVSLEKKSGEYIAIALLPADSLGERGVSLAIGLPFAAPPGEMFDLDLVRDVLERNEETTIPAGMTPSLLVVTDGAVWVTAGGGEAVQVTAGGIGQIEGDAVLAGASRSPATFVVARIGAALPNRVSLKNDGPAATPVAITSRIPEPETGPDRLWPEPTLADSTRDTDADGLTDEDESTLYGTEPRDSDTDDDGIDDAAEMIVHGTNPFLADTDGDGIADKEEVDAGTDPIDAASVPADLAPPPEPTIDDAAAVASPTALVTNPAATPPAALDPDGDLDGDGLSNADETDVYGTDPTQVDTDGDLFSDGGEVVSGRDPLDASDG